MFGPEEIQETHVLGRKNVGFVGKMTMEHGSDVTQLPDKCGDSGGCF